MLLTTMVSILCGIKDLVCDPTVPTEVRHAESQDILEKTAKDTETRRRAAEAAQKAMGLIQGKLSQVSKEVPRSLLQEQKDMSAQVHEVQTSFGDAMKKLTLAQQNESKLAVEVVRSCIHAHLERFLTL